MLYSNILVPIAFDHDRDTGQALEIARAIRAEGGKITALHVVEALPKYATEYLSEAQIAQAHLDIEESLKEAVDRAEDVEVLVVTGHSGRTILEQAEKKHADCVIISSHRPGLQDYFLGSTAARVVRHAQCAVHVIR
ncbi:MAG: universal stress protein [Pseudomonadota bacterium]